MTDAPSQPPRRPTLPPLPFILAVRAAGLLVAVRENQRPDARLCETMIVGREGPRSVEAWVFEDRVVLTFLLDRPWTKRRRGSEPQRFAVFDPPYCYTDFAEALLDVEDWLGRHGGDSKSAPWRRRGEDPARVALSFFSIWSQHRKP